MRQVSTTNLASLFRAPLCQGLVCAPALFGIVLNVELEGRQQNYNVYPGTRSNIKELWAFYTFWTRINGYMKECERGTTGEF